MKRLPVVVAGLAILLLAAHLWRDWGIVAGLAALCLAPLLFVPAPWAGRLVQGVLSLGALEWLRTLAVLIGERRQAGQPWVRLAVIVGGVAAFTVLAVALMERRRRRRPAASTAP